jgi:hypothetical protein
MGEEPNIPNNTEIDKALKEFEAKSNQEKAVQDTITPQSPKTLNYEEEGVSFDTDKEVEKYTAIKFYKETAEPKMVKAVMKYSKGVVKDQRQAEWILLGFVVVAIGTSLYLFFGTANSNSLQSRNTPLGQPIIRQVNNL